MKATTLETIHTTKTVYHFTEDLGVPLILPLQMIQIPRGTFIMGASKTEQGSSDDEQTQHQVTVNSFFMARYPVTQEQWQAIAKREDLRVAIELERLEPSDFKDDYQEGEQQITHWKRPVEQVSWQEAMEYCARLSKLTGKAYSLPTEAQWEYACRAGTTTPFHFGETITTDLANYDGTDENWLGKGNYGQGPKGIYRQQTTPVDYFNAPNAFGLSDMHGNVWEWCLDPWHNNYEDAPSNGQVWDQGKEDLYDNITKNLDVLLEEERTCVLRGGSWVTVPQNCRSADRSLNKRDSRGNGIGFRVMCGAQRSE
ncbi:MAG: formylglycine-generating enzyme family protein [Crocosphaera sp.]|nr:formylglycine-generating enzyme family protein [Crocosphaera sp.]